MLRKILSRKVIRIRNIFIFCFCFLVLYSSTPKVKSRKIARNRTDAVILLTMMRSGSSIVSSVFNQRSDVTFLYEPLFPFGERPCDEQAEERVEVLRHITRCQLDKIAPLYDKAFNRSKREEVVNSRCKLFGLCFPASSNTLKLHTDNNALKCHQRKERQNCPSLIDFTALNKYCKQSLLRATKVIYLCKLKWLVSLLKDEDYNIKVIHLVRDPRSTVNSRARYPYLAPREVKLRDIADLVCEQLILNVLYADEVLKKSNLRDKYLRVRFEDFASNPINKTQEMFDFVGINMNDAVKNWIRKSTSSKNADYLSRKDPSGTNRNPEVVLTAWRKQLTFAQVVEIQERCPNIFHTLGYQVYSNEIEYKNFSKLHFIAQN